MDLKSTIKLQPGQVYVLDRDRPIDIPDNKECMNCKVMQPNTLQYFTPKGQGPKKGPVLSTSNLCKPCKAGKGRAGADKRWKAYREMLGEPPDNSDITHHQK